MDKNTDKLEQLFAELFAGNSLLKIIFSGKRKKSLAYSKVMMRPLKISGKTKYQAEYTYPKKVTHSNLEKDDARSLALRLVCEDFKQLNIFTRDSEIQVLAAGNSSDYAQGLACPGSTGSGVPGGRNG